MRTDGLNFPMDEEITSARCVGIVADNNMSIALLIWYLLHHRINFFLLSPHSSRDPSFPGFCDLIIRSGQRPEPNPGYIRDESDLKPGSGAVILASSGSTGPSRFICFQAGRLIANAAACAKRLGLDENSKVLVPVPIGHMFGLGAGLLPALLSGSKICLIDKANIIRIADKLSEFQPDLTLTTPTIVKMLLLLKRKPAKRSLFVTAGEKLRPQDYIDFESGYGSLINLYGCTEMGAIATSDMADPLAGRAEGQVKPLPGVELEISPEKMILCKHPAAFDYYIDPLGRKRTNGQKANEFYQTGDLGVSPSAHRFILLGRADHCINRCGFLVSIQDIEHALMDLFTEVEQVTVIISAEENLRGPGLIAFCQLKKDSDPGKEYAKARCTGRMPGHWIPDEFHFVPDLPRLPSGKPDRILLQQKYLTLIHKQS